MEKVRGVSNIDTEVLKATRRSQPASGYFLNLLNLNRTNTPSG